MVFFLKKKLNNHEMVPKMPYYGFFLAVVLATILPMFSAVRVELSLIDVLINLLFCLPAILGIVFLFKAEND